MPMQYLNTRRHLLELMSKSGGGVMPITLREGPQHELFGRFYSIKQAGHARNSATSKATEFS